jgi:primosomal protein N'
VSLGGPAEPLDPRTGCALIDFAARYYQRALGEVALAALPPQLRELGSRPRWRGA